MNGQFSVDTICIGKNYRRRPEYNDMECEIIGGLQMRHWHCPETGERGVSMMYHVRWANGVESAERHFHLRKKPRPATDTGEMRIKEMFTKSPVVVPVDRPIPELA